ncbi:molybdopterin-dependent oxidoreductase [Frankia sp. CNm7]|uniref:Molybdopterin-dependent oxidoreductase n=1 Tax=Frankia nepalensis TaxID=1836974 RepID=A0A937RTX8_9ACTN|nr:molybdopterin-dependent oxidoreductase [Frankia nepalensis]MBL7500709.1 molybdopterin-dependent oxidoreductase [Frankia nepalensis]MBL7514464.1 molybdopterin-dependent oxidoreductase [Frankia nepalensis]MBL7523551.1 molybdopterin-dependent oxidoreductase [Frankia nepalensis]MBL7632738.1 molybdopterin-dependent oxidoreductase [Frankia nepalensis]
MGRRVVLGLAALGAIGVAVGADVERAANKVTAPLRKRDPTGLADLIPGGRFEIYSVASNVPWVKAADYRLKVHGLVDVPLTLSYADLEAMPQTQLTRDFQCVTGWRVTDVPWSGVRLADLLGLLGARPEARAVTFRSFDGLYDESLTIEQARRDDVLVALRMLDGPVSHEHGGPVRLYVAPMYGYKSLKWLGEIELVDKVSPGWWERRGYDVDAWIGKSNGRDDEPV